MVIDAQGNIILTLKLTPSQYQEIKNLQIEGLDRSVEDVQLKALTLYAAHLRYTGDGFTTLFRKGKMEYQFIEFGRRD